MDAGKNRPARVEKQEIEEKIIHRYMRCVDKLENMGQKAASRRDAISVPEDRTNKEGTCYPAINTIAREVHLSASTTKRAFSDSEKNGFIRKKQC